MNTPYRRARHRRVRRVHPERVHRHAQARPQVRERQRPHVVRREVHVRPPARDRRRERPVVAALQPRLGRRGRRHHRRLHLKSENDQIFPQILSSPAGPIVDEEVFSADELTSDDEIVEGHAFAGQYDITSYDFNNLISYKANPDYQGILGEAKTDTVNVKYYTDASNLKLDVQEGNIDVAHRTLSDRHRGPPRERQREGRRRPRRRDPLPRVQLQHDAVRRPTPEADPAKALAVRQAIANLIDRDAISEDVYKGTFTPLYSYVPEGLTGANEALKALRRRQRRAGCPTRPKRSSRPPASRRRSTSRSSTWPSATARRRATSTRSSRTTSSRAACSP